MSNFLDNWNKNKFSIYKSEEKTVLKLIEKMNNFLGDMAKGLDTKTDINGDHKGSWQGLNRPTLSEEGLRSTVEQHIEEIKQLKNIKTEYNVMDYGFDKTGAQDNSDKLNYLINLVHENGGGVIKFPKGRFKVNGQIVCKPYVYLKGNIPWRGKDEGGYTIFDCYSLNAPQFLLREYCSLDSFYFNYPLQNDSDSNLPITYDWTIATDTTHLCDDIQLKDLYFYNSYKAISLVRGGRFNLKNIYGQPLYKGILIDDSRDMNNIDRVEFWTFKNYVGTEMYNYILENATAFEFKTVDGVICNNLFAFGYNKGYHLNGSVWATFNGCTADKCYSPILVDNVNIVEFIGGSFIGSSFKSTVCKINNVSDSFKLIGCNFFGGCSVGVLNYSNKGKILIDCNFKNTDDKISIAVINSGDNDIIVRKNNIKDKVFGKAIIDGVKSINDSTLIKTITKENLGLNNSDIVNVEGGFRIDLGKTIQGEKMYSGNIRIDNDGTLPTGLYYIEFDIIGKYTSDRKRIAITVAKDDGSKYFNSLIGDIPFIEEKTKIRIPLYLGSKPYITLFKFDVSYYNENIPTSDYIEFSDLKVYKMNNKTLNSTLENAYISSYIGDDKINYEINL